MDISIRFPIDGRYSNITVFVSLFTDVYPLVECSHEFCWLPAISSSGHASLPRSAIQEVGCLDYLSSG